MSWEPPGKVLLFNMCNIFHENYIFFRKTASTGLIKHTLDLEHLRTRAPYWLLIFFFRNVSRNNNNNVSRAEWKGNDAKSTLRNRWKKKK